MDLEKESKDLFDAWDSYWNDMTISSVKGNTERFKCLELFDKEFCRLIRPLLLDLFERNPHIRRGRGYPEDLKIYKEFIKPFRVPARRKGYGYPNYEMISLEDYSFRHFLDGYYQGKPIVPRVAGIEKAEDVQKFYNAHSAQVDNGRDYLRRMWERYNELFWSLIDREKTLQAVAKPKITLIKEEVKAQARQEVSKTPSPKPSSTTLRKILYILCAIAIILVLWFTPIVILTALVINYLFFTFLYSKEAAALAIFFTIIMFLDWLIKKFINLRK